MNTQYTNAYRSLVGVDALLPLSAIYIENLGSPYLTINPIDLHHYEMYDNQDWVPEDVRYKPYGGFRLAEVRDDIGRMRFPCWEYGGTYYEELYGDDFRIFTEYHNSDSEYDDNLTYRH
jgi:hypothetical protein